MDDEEIKALLDKIYQYDKYCIETGTTNLIHMHLERNALLRVENAARALLNRLSHYDPDTERLETALIHLTEIRANIRIKSMGDI